VLLFFLITPERLTKGGQERLQQSTLPVTRMDCGLVGWAESENKLFIPPFRSPVLFYSGTALDYNIILRRYLEFVAFTELCIMS
jgi:hypothetical protein